MQPMILFSNSPKKAEQVNKTGHGDIEQNKDG